MKALGVKLSAAWASRVASGRRMLSTKPPPAAARGAGRDRSLLTIEREAPLEDDRGS
jgi:hypothetical protein